MYDLETNTFTGKLSLKSYASRRLRKTKNYIKRNGLQKLLTVAALIVIYIFFAIFGRNFFSFDTFTLILRHSYFIGFLAIGVTFPIITGGMDLSIGASSLFAAMAGGVLFNNMGMPMWMVLIAVIVIGVSVGILNGVLISYMGLPPFIATLGTLMVTKGLSGIVSNSQTIYFPTVTDPTGGWFRYVFNATSTNFPSGAIVLLFFAIFAAIILNKTVIGRYIFAIGSNEEAARLSGVKTRKWKIFAYAISGFYCGLAGIAFAASYSGISPGAGQGYELDAIAAVVIGGTSLSGGIGSISGTVIGVYIMSVLKSGLPSIGVEQFFQYFTIGVVVIISVFIDVYRIKLANTVKKSDNKKMKVLIIENKIDELRIKIEYMNSDKKNDHSSYITDIKKDIEKLKLERKSV